MKNYAESYYLKILFDKVKVKEVMSQPAVTIGVKDKLSEAVLKFKTHGIFYLVVVNFQNEPIGLLSTKYVYKTQSPRKLLSPNEFYSGMHTVLDGDAYYEKNIIDGYSLKNVMKLSPFIMEEDDCLTDALHQMAKKNITCIPIVDKKNIVKGILTDREILGFFSNLIKE